MTVPVADQRRLIHILADDLQPRIDWAYALEQTIALLGGGYLTAGNGDPNGLVTKPEGYLFLDLTTPAVWQNQNGGTVWTNISAGGGSGLPDPWTANQTSGEVVGEVDGVAKTPLTLQAIAGQLAALLNLKDENGATAAVTGGLTPWGDVGVVVFDPTAASPFEKGWVSFGLNDAQESGGIKESDLVLSYGDADENVVEFWCGPPDGQSGFDIVVRDSVDHSIRSELSSQVNTYNGFSNVTASWSSPTGDSLAEIGIFAHEALARLVVFPGQTTRPVRVQDSTGNDLASVLPSGAIGTSAGEPADADINPGECFRYFDPTNGAARTCLKGKTLDGTVVFGFGPMTP